MTTELTRCSNSKRSLSDSTDQTRSRLSPSPTTGKEFFRFPHRQRRKSSEKDEIGEKSVETAIENRSSTCTSTCTSPSASASANASPTITAAASHRKPSAEAVITKRFKRAFSVHQETGAEDENNPKSSPKQKGSKKNEFKKFGLVQLPNPNPPSDFFKQRASFHSDTSNSCAAASTSGLGERDTGIICSNSDLRSILTTTGSGRRAGDVKRERMKNYRSLSFDSSVFRIPRKGSSAETPVWFSWNKSGARQPEVNSQQPEERKNVIQIRLTSESPEDDVLDSCSSASEGSPQLSSKVQVVIEEVKDVKDVTEAAGIAGIPWDERSVVDVNVLGNAIESYLGERRASGDDNVKPNDDSIQDVSLCSSLKSMFVK